MVDLPCFIVKSSLSCCKRLFHGATDAIDGNADDGIQESRAVPTHWIRLDIIAENHGKMHWQSLNIMEKSMETIEKSMNGMQN